MEYCKFIWDGRDYVPYVWNDWLKDPHGILAVAEYRGHAIGCAKVTLLAPGQWWFEGFRVDPKFQGLKVGSHIHAYVDEWWMQYGDGTVRLMTNSKNVRVHYLCEKLGFRKIGEAVAFIALPLEDTTDNFTPAKDLKECADFAFASESLSLSNGVADFGWRVLQPDESALRTFTTPSADFEHKALWWREREALITTWDDDEDGEPVLGVGLVACRMKDMAPLLKDIRKLAGKKKNVFWIPFSHPQVFDALKEAGWSRKWENSGFLFEKRHA